MPESHPAKAAGRGKGIGGFKQSLPDRLERRRLEGTAGRAGPSLAQFGFSVLPEGN